VRGNAEVVVLGAGIAGLSTSYHFGHDGCRVFEANPYYGGHLHTRIEDGFVWDEGPHISFTKSEYVRQLFAESVEGDYREFDVRVGNYFQGSWIDHPAQTNLYQIPEPLRSRCIESFLQSRPLAERAEAPANYREWLHRSLGPVFADTFPAAYTRKYWTTEPENMTIDWVGPRMYTPSVEQVRAAARGPLEHSTYYITTARYPERGGFIEFTKKLAEGARIEYGKRLVNIHFGDRRLGFADGTTAHYDVLASTIPLPTLLGAAEDAPDSVKEAATRLRCSELLAVNVAAAHPSRRPETYFYVYDEDKYATRVTIVENLSSHNTPPDTTGLQVEVYGSAYRPLPTDHEAVARRVAAELVEMGVVDGHDAVISVKATYVPWANVIFDHDRRPALKAVNGFLDEVGVLRAGRYAEWKYMWTDGCVLSGRNVAQKLRGRDEPAAMRQRPHSVR
jgi:protoporphyrinogen oxidase